jgi:F-type H+-transporting ATPase subunit epsilon
VTGTDQAPIAAPSSPHHLAGGLTLRVVTPEGAVYDGPVTVVVVPSHDGETAFLKGHAAFVGLLGIGELRYHAAGGGTAHYFLGGGVVQVVHDVVTVLAESVVAARALDTAKARTELDAASHLPTATDEQIATKTKALLTARAKLRIGGQAHGGAPAPAAH